MKSGCDGVMIGRGLFGKPWFFNKDLAEHMEAFDNNREILKERLKVMVEHTKLYEEKLGDIKSFAIMKKHFKAYVHGFDGAKEFRTELMECENANEVEEKVKEWMDR
jgi:tRNA-dihydrouridine synthase